MARVFRIAHIHNKAGFPSSTSFCLTETFAGSSNNTLLKFVECDSASDEGMDNTWRRKVGNGLG